MSSLSCDVVLLPCEDIIKKAIEASKQLSSIGTLFNLDNQNFFVHISLYMLQLKKEDMAQVEQILTDLVSKFEPFDLIACTYASEERFVDVEYELNDQLVELQNQILTALNPVRDGMRPKDAARLAEATGVVRENLEQYGYRGVGSLFRPHITLARTEDEQKNTYSILPSFSQFDGSFPRLGLFEMGDNGTCIRQIATFDLKHS